MLKKLTFIFLCIICLLGGAIVAQAQDDADRDAYKQVNLVFCNAGETTDSLDFSVRAGEKQEICYDLINRSSLYTWVSVNFVDAAPRGDGKLISCSDDAAPKDFFANYIEPGSDRVFLNPGQVVRKTAFVTFPPSVNGMRYACASIQRDNPEEGKGVVNVVLRSIYKIKARVSGDGSASTDNLPAGFRLIQSQGAIRILQNTEGLVVAELAFEIKSNLNSDINVKIAVQGVGYTYQDERKTTLTPEEAQVMSIHLPALPFYEGLYRFSFDITEYVLGSPVVSTQTMYVMFWPMQLLLPLVMVVLLLISWVAWKIAHNHRLTKAQQSYEVLMGDTLSSLARRFGCTWQDLAKANDLRAPYILKAGQKITVFDLRRR